ncbi:hypothetical protein EW145_g5601 [Phellinidium pouzarii]|uniref:30S ribosomal protein S17 n=1 Tax=Phellinidium pouzarii TaxID=167371 RepID=A0A4S4KZD8_9AGAM|nr:hypothetical protein EW145_g5601 [Phellinidium pouzarii]
MPPLILQGIVTKVGYMNKTATVTVSRWAVHPRTQKRFERSKKYLTHDPENTLRQDDVVTIQNCPPVSARKRFTLYKVLKSSGGDRIQRHLREAQEAASNASGLATATNLNEGEPFMSATGEATATSTTEEATVTSIAGETSANGSASEATA